MANRRIVQAGPIESRAFQGGSLPAGKRQVFAEIPPAACIGLTAVWSGAVGGMLLIMILLRLFS
jgi:hypothetical protein